MDKLKDTELLKFHPDTLEIVRKACGLEEPNVLAQSLDILASWLKKQDHFVKKDFSPGYLERTLIMCQGSVESAKAKMDKICTTRTLLQQYFDSFDVLAEIEPYLEGFTHAILPTLTARQERVIFFRNTGFKINTLLPLYKHLIKIFEYLKSHDYAVGFHFIIDMSEMNIIEMLPKLNPIDMRNAMTIVLEGLGFKLISLHMITTSKMVDALYKIFNQTITSKITDGIFVHKDITSVYDAFPRALMPKDYGGSEKTLKELNDDLLRVLSAEENIKLLRDMSTAVTDEYLRPTGSFNEQYMGMPGSFRSLVVD